MTRPRRGPTDISDPGRVIRTMLRRYYATKTAEALVAWLDERLARAEGITEGPNPPPPMPLTMAEIREDNQLWTVRQLLQRAIEHIDTGEAPSDGALLILIQEGEEGAFTTHTMRAKIKRDREVAIMAAKLHSTVADWIEK